MTWAIPIYTVLQHCVIVIHVMCLFANTNTFTCPPEPVGLVGPWPDQNFGRAYFPAGLSLFLWSVGWGSRATPRTRSQVCSALSVCTHVKRMSTNTSPRITANTVIGNTHAIMRTVTARSPRMHSFHLLTCKYFPLTSECYKPQEPTRNALKETEIFLGRHVPRPP